MIENHMIVDDLWEFIPRRCKRCNRPINKCSCDDEDI